MRKSLQISLPPMEVKAVVPATRTEDKPVVLIHEMLRAAIDESGWKHDAIAAVLGVDGPYLAKMLTEEKPIGARHLMALPDDVEAIFARLYAEGHGLLVVPQVSEADARRHLATGLFSLLVGKKDVA